MCIIDLVVQIASIAVKSGQCLNIKKYVKGRISFITLSMCNIRVFHGINSYSLKKKLETCIYVEDVHFDLHKFTIGGPCSFVQCLLFKNYMSEMHQVSKLLGV